MRFVLYTGLLILFGFFIGTVSKYLETNGAPEIVTFVSLVILGAPIIYLLGRGLGLIKPRK